MSKLYWIPFVFVVAIGTIITHGSVDRYHRPLPRFYRDDDDDGIVDSDDSAGDDFQYDVLVEDDPDADDKQHDDYYVYRSSFVTPTTPPPDYETGEEPHEPDFIAQHEFLLALGTASFKHFIVAHMHRLFVDQYTFHDGLSVKNPHVEHSQKGVIDGGPFARRIVFRHRNCEFSLLLHDRKTAAVYLSARDGVPTTVFVTTLPLPNIIVHEEEIERERREKAAAAKNPPPKQRFKKKTVNTMKTEHIPEIGRYARRVLSVEDRVMDVVAQLLYPAIIMMIGYALYLSFQFDFYVVERDALD